MYIAMNRFRVAPGREADFESIWAKRKSYLDSMPGFREFHLLRGPTEEGATLYASHSVWASYGAFQTWTNSEAFRAAHAQGRLPDGVLLGPPHFEGFEVVM